VVNGEKLKRIFAHIMRIENRNGEGECYQVNGKVGATYSEKEKKLVSLSIEDAEVKDNQEYTVCLQGYHFNKAKDFLDITQEELLAPGKNKVVTTSAQEVLEEFLRNNQNTTRKIEGRLFYKQ
jgi:5'-nucleotidase